jgi:predicted AlkP superfamily pyrophosphatase or phosphodiesterase
MVVKKHPFIALCIAAALACATPARVRPAKNQQLPGPKLVVIIVVDQLRTDYIALYGHTWTKGLRRLVDQGAWFTEAAYPYLKTVTCAGHSTISTGTFPATHGMILNAWYDRKQGRMVNCTDDPRVQPVVYGRELKGMGNSAENLRAETFADVLVSQPANRNGRVISFSIKARSAIALGGRKADAVTWFDTARGLWLTSRAYSLAGVPFVRSFIDKNPVTRDFGKTWERSMPPEAYKFADEDINEKPPGWTTTFPHVLKGTGKEDAHFFEQWRDSPFADDYLGAMALDAIDRLKLGRRDRTDLLAISFSALDAVGHDFGPRSHEVQDLLFRLDSTIGRLLDRLDQAVGPNEYVVAFSSDHGVAAIPEHVKPEGVDAGRVNGADVAKQAEAVLQKHFGPGKYVAGSTYTDLYFEEGVEARIEADARIKKDLKEALLAIPGVGWVFAGAELQGKRDSADRVERAAALSQFPGRSGDWIVVPKLNWYFRASDATTHGTPHWYDAQVPVIFYGAGIKPGRHSGPATPADIAPTLAHLLGFTVPRAEGRVLTEALTPPQMHAPGQSR